MGAQRIVTFIKKGFIAALVLLYLFGPCWTFLSEINPDFNNTLAIALKNVNLSVKENVKSVHNRVTKTTTHITFYVMGDIPYSMREAKILTKQIKEIPPNAQFVFHVGDIMKSKHGCHEEDYIDVKSRLLNSNAPVFIIPGDNDWSDCSEPSQAWSYWKKHFKNFDLNWKHSLSVKRQDNRKENVAFFLENVLFVGLNIVGLPVQDKKEWTSRLSDDLEFTIKEIQRYKRRQLLSVVILGHARPHKEHNEFFQPLAKTVKFLKKPVAYIHGDGHRYQKEKNFLGIRNFVRVQVDQGGVASPLKVEVMDDGGKIFHFVRTY